MGEAKSIKNTGLPWLWLSVIVLILDQWSKNWATSNLAYLNPVEVLPMLNWTLMFNEGVAFSFLADQGGWQRWALSALTFVIVAWLLHWMWQNRRQMKLQNVSLALVIGGALGNVYDRLLLGHVVDFIDVFYKSWHWPAFNVADSAICVGAVLLIIDMIKNKEENPS